MLPGFAFSLETGGMTHRHLTRQPVQAPDAGLEAAHCQQLLVTGMVSSGQAGAQNNIGFSSRP
jgi:hypothetical protein